jgi:3',5'-cyclic AMP phosphodiesterase CpdA
MRIAHLSDLHFGRIADAAIVDALQRDVNAAGPDVVCISGDLTMRARRREFKQAQGLLAGLEAPVLVVPGNHDVYGWKYAPIRLTNPLRRYRRMVTPDLEPTFESEGLAVLGLNTAYGHSFKGGRITPRHLVQIRRFFGQEPGGRQFRVLVIHHHLKRLRQIGRHDVARRARRALRLLSKCEVDVVLCGHLHVSHVEPLMVDGRRLVIASAGTVTSSRWRGPVGETNFFNLIDVFEDRFTIEERAYTAESGAFVPGRVFQFQRST